MDFHGFFHIGNFMIPTDELHHLSEGWVYHQPVNLGIIAQRADRDTFYNLN